jgi:hypothetical protein
MDSSKLRTYTSIAEIVSALAIVVSLLYAGYEFRHSSTLTSRDVDVLLFERSHNTNRLLLEAPGLAEIVLVGRTNPESLSGADWLRFETYQRMWFNTWEIAWYHHADGILNDVTWNEWDYYFKTAAKRRSSDVWAGIRIDFQGEFRDYVDAVMGVGSSMTPGSAVPE